MQDYEQRDPEEVGNALTWLRHDRRLTQQEVVERASLRADGISKIYYSQIERGVRKPSPGKLQNILSALGSNEQELEQILTSPPWTTPPRSTPLPSQPASPSETKVRMRSASPKPASLWGDTLGAAATPESGTMAPATLEGAASSLPPWSSKGERLLHKFSRLNKNEQLTVEALMDSYLRGHEG